MILARTVLYQHPEGMGIYFDPLTPALHCYDESGAVSITIGSLALIEMGHELIKMGESLKAGKPKNTLSMVR